MSSISDRDDREALIDYFHRFLQLCLDAGMQAPFYLFALGTNGYTVVFRVNPVDGSDALAMQPWAERNVDDVLQVPIFVGAVDPSTGLSLRGDITSEGIRVLN